MYFRIALLLVVVAFPLPSVAAACDAACLQRHLHAYVDALVKRDPSTLPIAPKVKYTENGRPLKIREGLWEKTTAVTDYAHYLADANAQQALFIGVVTEGDLPAIVSLRIGLRDGAIAEVEHIVARKESHALFAPNALQQPNPLLASAISFSQRVPREQLIRSADSYFTGIERHSSKLVQAAEDCQRVENGVQTTHQPGRGSRNCQQSADLLTYIKSVDNRRFPIVDVEHGVVVATVTFNIPGTASNSNDAAIATDAQVAARLRQPRTLLLSEWFKIEGGLITHIEAVMHNLPPGADAGW
jgi:hypothetical protein